MKQLTYSTMAAARLRANKQSYGNLVLGIFLSIFMISTLVLSMYGIYQAELEKRYDKVGFLDMVMLDNDSVTEADMRSFDQFDRLGHAYISGIVTDCNVYVGGYDEVGLSLMNLEPLEGRLPEVAGEIALEASAMEILDVTWQIGDTVEFAITPVDGTEETRSFTVVGILPERSIYLSISDHNGLSQFPAIVTSAEEPAFSVGRLGIHYLMGLAKSQTLEGTLRAFWEKFQGNGNVIGDFYGLSISGEQRQFAGMGNLIEADRDMFNLILMAGILAGSLILSCGIGISGAMEGVLSRRREEIGVLRALGATRQQIRRMYGRENMILALVVSPLSIVISCAAVWGLSLLMPASLKFTFKLWLLLPVAVFSIIVILMSGYLPLVRASKLMPMSVIRDTAMLRRGKGIKSRKEFPVAKLISARQVRFNPTRQIGAALLVGLMLLCSGMLGGVVYGFRDYITTESPGFSITNNCGYSTQNYIQFYHNEPMSKQSIQQIRGLERVKSIRIDREMPILAQVDTIPRYALLSTFYEQYGMLDDTMFEEAMSLLSDGSDFYENIREQVREAYLQLLKDYQFESQVFQISIMTVDLNNQNAAILKDNLTEGNIDIDAINGGKQVLICAPDIWFKNDGNGGTRIWHSEEAVKKDPSAEGAQRIGWNDTFSAGQLLPLTQLYSEDEGVTVIREDAQVQICGIVDDLGGLPYYSLSSCTVITTEQGLENMGFRMEGLRRVDVYLDGELTLEEEEVLARQITAIARRSEGYSVQNDMESYRKQELANRQELILCISVVTVFFAVAVGMIVSSVTRQLGSEGRAIGMLRAVGADEKAILGCYRGQLDAAVLGGLGVTIALIVGSLGAYALDAATSNYNMWYFSLVIQLVIVTSTVFLMAAACWIVCRYILRQRIREIVSKSIIDNIREL